MKFRYRIIQSTALALLLVFVGVITLHAQMPAGTTQAPMPAGTKCPTSNPNCTSTANTNTNSQNSGFNLDIKLKNPLEVDTIQEAIKLFVNAVVRLAIPVIVIFFLWSGLMFIFARGNPEKIRQAKNMFFYTIIGTLLILGAWTITNAIIGTVNSITN